MGLSKLYIHYTKYTTGKPRKVQKTLLDRGNDIVVATPKSVLMNSEAQGLYFSDVRHVILDEADTMFDEGFGPEVGEIVRICRRKNRPARFIMVSATLKKAVQKLIDEQIPDMKKVREKEEEKEKRREKVNDIMLMEGRREQPTPFAGPPAPSSHSLSPPLFFI
jgi:superfamily II DNA/RNA helicase